MRILGFSGLWVVFWWSRVWLVLLDFVVWLKYVDHLFYVFGLLLPTTDALVLLVMLVLCLCFWFTVGCIWLGLFVLLILN